MQYPQWWERLLAALVDGAILAVVAYLILFIFRAFAFSGPTAYAILSLAAWLINTAAFVGYKVVLEGGSWQATLGKMIFGLKVVNDAGQRGNFGQILIRTWPWWLALINVIGAVLPAAVGVIFGFLLLFGMIAILATFFAPPGGRCIQDKTAALHVIKAGPGMINIQVNTGR